MRRSELKKIMSVVAEGEATPTVAWGTAVPAPRRNFREEKTLAGKPADSGADLDQAKAKRGKRKAKSRTISALGSAANEERLGVAPAKTRVQTLPYTSSTRRDLLSQMRAPPKEEVLLGAQRW